MIVVRVAARKPLCREVFGRRFIYTKPDIPTYKSKKYQEFAAAKAYNNNADARRAENMDYVKNFQRAIDYVEENLKNEIVYSEVAKRAYLSEFHFQKLFLVLTGYTLGDYIRRRKLALAAKDLVDGKKKVIDVALDYGYESPESFSRAFTKFHGVTPLEAKKGAKTVPFSKLTVKITVSGGSLMDYRIENLCEMKLVCRKERFLKQHEMTSVAISKFWDKCKKEGYTEKICRHIPKDPVLKGLLGISFSAEGKDSDSFPYAIASEYRGEPVEDGLEVIDLPAAKYAVFTAKGKMPEAFVNTYSKIIKEFFVQSGYEYANGAEIEVYPSDDAQNPDYTCEIWVAVK